MLSDERLAELRANLLTFPGAYRRDVRALLREVDRLRAALAAAEQNPVLRVVKHERFRSIETEWMLEPECDDAVAVRFFDRDGTANHVEGPTTEAACEAALKALEGGDDGE